jgi:methylmalonyl-CoA/ethylmalonyl-CoA epimerase
MQKIEHIGIAVNSLEEGEKLYESLLGVSSYKRETVESEKVITSFFRQGPNKIELLAPIGEDSPISKFLVKRGPGIHHVAYAVTDIKAEMKRLSEEGFTLLSKEPKKGADNKLVCFLHPKSSGGVLVELCQEISD